METSTSEGCRPAAGGWVLNPLPIHPGRGAGLQPIQPGVDVSTRHTADEMPRSSTIACAQVALAVHELPRTASMGGPVLVPAAAATEFYDFFHVPVGLPSRMNLRAVYVESSSARQWMVAPDVDG